MRASLLGLVVSLQVFLVACGSADPVKSDPQPIVPTQRTRLALEALNPIRWAFDRVSPNSTELVQVNRQILLNEYHQLIEPQLSADQSEALTYVTGVGLEAQFNGEALPLRMGLIARQWNADRTEILPETRIFSGTGVDLSRAQQFAIGTSQDSQYVITGMGLRLRDGTATKLELKRVSISGQSTGFGSLSSSTRVELPAGWVVTGLILAIDQINATTPPRKPFVEDFILYSARLTEI
jgi:hypothetical protein